MEDYTSCYCYLLRRRCVEWSWATPGVVRASTGGGSFVSRAVRQRPAFIAGGGCREGEKNHKDGHFVVVAAVVAVIVVVFGHFLLRGRRRSWRRRRRRRKGW